MADEYKPTRRVETPGGVSGPAGPSSGGQPEYHPTVLMSDVGAGQYGYGSQVVQPGAAKTERLRVGPPTFAWLVVVEGIHAGHIFRLHPDVTLVGRDPSCDIVLDDEAASRQHAKVRVVEGEDKRNTFVLHDLATENGTFVNDEEIAKHELSDGDRILIGRTKLVFKQIQV